jgi:hypothetical protein
MSEKNISPDISIAKKKLDLLWSTVTQEKVKEIDNDINILINSDFVAIRFCLPTQLLGKLTDNSLNCLCLQKGSGKEKSLWDPRSFASKVIVPWIANNQNILGTSTDPYVSKPLRKPFLEPNPSNVKGKDEWTLLYNVLFEVERKSSITYTQKKLLQTLQCIYKKFEESNFEYYIPDRISTEQVLELINAFLSEGSGGDRGLSVAAALFETFAEFFKIYSKINRFAINASDKATGLAGDIQCLDENNKICLIVEVKERNLSLTDIQSSVLKARKISLKELLFNAPGINSAEEDKIIEVLSKTWASGTHAYILGINDLLKVGLCLTGAKGRKYFLERVCYQLDSFNTQPINRLKWKQLLEEI